MIKIKNLSYTYSDGTRALRNINISIPEEHIFAVMGLSGSGKTTLLNCIGRFLKPQEGTIYWNDADIFRMPETEFRTLLGVVFQRLNLFPHMTILENMILAPCRIQGCPAKDARDNAFEMLERLGIPELAHNYPSQVSGGQAQRAAIARGLMLKPQVMLLDEPTSALDARITEDFSQWLRELHSDTSFIIVTHDLPFAESVARKGIFMDSGEILESGSIQKILSQLQNGNSQVDYEKN
ncbi:MAG: ATP-binding cassette domain-containing protein [Victivallales bacterium]|nr:ATP-binding cassette domain-containing protein [Victivallales bacterium]